VAFYRSRSIFDSVALDHANYYSGESLACLAAGFGVGAIMANTSIDGDLHSRFQRSVRGSRPGSWSDALHAQREYGAGRYALPVFAAAWATGRLTKGVPIADSTGEWGERSIRSILVGDYLDGLHAKCVGSSLFLFFACLAPAVTFGGVMAMRTNGQIGAVEMIVASAFCGVLWFAKSSGLGILFPVFIELLVPVRLLAGRFTSYNRAPDCSRCRRRA
jgi:hypothetical protein